MKALVCGEWKWTQSVRSQGIMQNYPFVSLHSNPLKAAKLSLSKPIKEPLNKPLATAGVESYCSNDSYGSTGVTLWRQISTEDPRRLRPPADRWYDQAQGQRRRHRDWEAACCCYLCPGPRALWICLLGVQSHRILGDWRWQVLPPLSYPSGGGGNRREQTKIGETWR